MANKVTVNGGSCNFSCTNDVPVGRIFRHDNNVFDDNIYMRTDERKVVNLRNGIVYPTSNNRGSIIVVPSVTITSEKSDA